MEINESNEDKNNNNDNLLEKYSESNKEKENENNNLVNNTNNLIEEKNSDLNNDNFLYSDKILGRFSLPDKINIINKLNVIVYGKIKKELLMELNRKRIENKLLLLKSQYKTALIMQKRLHSLVQVKMLRDFNFKKNLKDLRKKLMDEKIEKLKYKNLVFIMRTYGIYREDKNYR